MSNEKEEVKTVEPTMQQRLLAKEIEVIVKSDQAVNINGVVVNIKAGKPTKVSKPVYDTLKEAGVLA